MSIDDTLANLIAAGKLYEFVVHDPDPDFKRRRQLYMSEEAYRACPPSGPSSRNDFRGQPLINMRTQIEDFIGGEEMEQDRDLKRLRPHHDIPNDREVWEIRVVSQPQSRLLGWFIAPDRFVVTHIELRDDIDTDDWPGEIEKAQDKRERLFGELPVHKGWVFSQYITENGVAAYELR